MTKIKGIISVAAMAVLALGCSLNKASSSGASARNENQPSSSSSSSTSTTNRAAAPDIDGKYNITGTNPDGGSYKGTLEVITRGDVYQFRWNAGTQYDGVGIQNGNIVAVAYTTGANGQGCGVVDFDIQS